jgi:hypothetical protein
MFKFNATTIEIVRVVTNAINASESPCKCADVTYGEVYEEIAPYLRAEEQIDIRLWDGRRVHLVIDVLSENLFSIIPFIDSERQTWAATYPTVRELVSESMDRYLEVV